MKASSTSNTSKIPQNNKLPIYPISRELNTTVENILYIHVL